MGRNALLLAAGTLASRVLGMARETLIAASFDRGATDAFFLAWRLPNALRALLAEGAAASALNPILGEAYEKPAEDPPEKRKANMRAVLSELSGAAFVALAVVTVLGMVFARPLFGVLAGGLRSDPERFELGVQLLRVLFPYIFFMGWFALGNTALRLLNVFRPGAFAPVMLNVAFVAAPFALTPPLVKLGVHPVFALAIAALLGGVLQVLWLRPALRAAKMLPRPVLRLSPAVRRLGALFVPMVYGQAVYQLNIILAGNFLASQPRGATSYFSYAQRLADIPQGLFAVALASSAAVAMQKPAALGELDGVARVYEDAVRKTAVIALPIAILLAVYAEAVVPLVFSYGHFGRNADGAFEVAASLRWQACSVAVNAFVLQTSAVFSALQKRSQVVRCATISLVVFGVVGYFATPALGHTGVAAAMLASGATQLTLLVLSLRSEVPARFYRVFPTVARALAATGVMALAARFAVRTLPVTHAAFAHRALAVLCGGALVGLYLALAWALKIEEIRALGAKALARLRRRPRR